MTEKAIVTAPARLHFGLVNMHLESASVDGGFGLAVCSPKLRVTMQRAESFGLQCPPELDACTRGYMRLASKELEPRYSVWVETENSLHSGLGLGTQLGLSIAAAHRSLNAPPPFDREAIGELAQGVGRAGTSGVGCYCFSRGGFVVDLGRPRREKSFLGPSSAFGGLETPTALPRIEFPEWHVVIAIPRGLPRISGSEEVKLFGRYAPIYKWEAAELTDVLLYQLIPSILRRRFGEFCMALESTRRIGFKRREIAHNGEAFARVIEHLERAGLAGVTVSSWGPAVVGFAENGCDSIRSALEGLKDRDVLNEFWITGASNEGATVWSG